MTRPKPNWKPPCSGGWSATCANRTDVQNIDLMILAGFCRNCLSNWYAEAAEERASRSPRQRHGKIVYGMPYDEWKAKHQTEATPEQTAAYEASKPH